MYMLQSVQLMVFRFVDKLASRRTSVHSSVVSLGLGVGHTWPAAHWTWTAAYWTLTRDQNQTVSPQTWTRTWARTTLDQGQDHTGPGRPDPRYWLTLDLEALIRLGHVAQDSLECSLSEPCSEGRCILSRRLRENQKCTNIFENP